MTDTSVLYHLIMKKAIMFYFFLQKMLYIIEIRIGENVKKHLFQTKP